MTRFLVGSLVAVLLFTSLARGAAIVAKVDPDRKTVVVKIDSRYQMIFTDKVTIVDKNGRPTTAQLREGDRIEITFEKDGKKTIVTRVKLLDR
jgi:hypothetical protein